jgi:hypothetical protein
MGDKGRGLRSCGWRRFTTVFEARQQVGGTDGAFSDGHVAWNVSSTRSKMVSIHLLSKGASYSKLYAISHLKTSQKIFPMTHA